MAKRSGRLPVNKRIAALNEESPNFGRGTKCRETFSNYDELGISIN